LAELAPRRPWAIKSFAVPSLWTDFTLSGQFQGVLLMHRLAALLYLTFLMFLAAGTSVRGEETPPPWAYPVNPPDFSQSPDDGQLKHVPDSLAAFTVGQTRDRFFAPDWHPADHPPLPEIVAHGRKPDVYACGFCHRADGPGGPEMPVSPAFRSLTSCSKWPTSRAAREQRRCHNACHRL
jgi:hypothetical protein